MSTVGSWPLWRAFHNGHEQTLANGSFPAIRYAFLTQCMRALEHGPGLNLALSAAPMRPYIEELHKAAPETFISCCPDAGLPNPMSETGFDETPEMTSRLLWESAAEGAVNIVDGCCGTTPEHIGAIHHAAAPLATRPVQRGVIYKEAA